MIGPETPLRLGEHDEPEPELMVYPRVVKPEDVRADTVLLVVEGADSSIAFDLGLKQRVYASFGVRETWVINVRTLETTIFRNPDRAAGTYAFQQSYPGTEIIAPALVPVLAVRLCDLSLD